MSWSSSNDGANLLDIDVVGEVSLHGVDLARGEGGSVSGVLEDEARSRLGVEEKGGWDERVGWAARLVYVRVDGRGGRKGLAQRRTVKPHLIALGVKTPGAVLVLQRGPAASDGWMSERRGIEQGKQCK